MKLSKLKVTLAGLMVSAILSVPAWGTTDARATLPGTLNYVEGQAAFGRQTLDAKSVGSTTLNAGQSLTTDDGRVEILLTPGVFARVGENSAVRMVIAKLTDTQVALDKGQMLVEVDLIHPENNLQVTESGVSTRILKTGLYGFDANQNQVRVFKGEATTLQGDKQVTIKEGRELALNGNQKPQKFDKKQYEASDLYRFSSLRSDYLAEANVDTARVYVNDGWYGSGWFGAGWYWSPWFSAYTFLPGDGFLYSPFGWGYYSPGLVWRAPYYRGGLHYHQFGPGYRPPAYAHGGFRGPANGFRGYQGHAPAMTGPRASMGGFNGGGGFHGGGGFGGRR